MSELPKKQNRIYRISDTKAMENCLTVHNLMNTGDLAAFTAFDPTFVQAWLDDWAAEITDAQALKTDETYRDEMQQETEAVAAVMAQARTAYRTTKHFVQKAFPNNRAIQNEFGLDDYDRARQSDIRLHEFMLSLHAVATKYSAELTDPTVGYSTAQISNLETIANNLQAANLSQETHKKNQQTTTQARIQAHNVAWEKRQLVSSAAKLVYAEDYAKYQQYLPPASEGNAEDYALIGMIQDSDTNAPIEEASISINDLSISTTSDELGNYGLADNIPPGTYDVEITADGYVSQTQSVTITSADVTVTLNVNMVKV